MPFAEARNKGPARRMHLCRPRIEVVGKRTGKSSSVGFKRRALSPIRLRRVALLSVAHIKEQNKMICTMQVRRIDVGAPANYHSLNWPLRANGCQPATATQTLQASRPKPNCSNRSPTCATLFPLLSVLQPRPVSGGFCADEPGSRANGFRWNAVIIEMATKRACWRPGTQCQLTKRRPGLGLGMQTRHRWHVLIFLLCSVSLPSARQTGELFHSCKSGHRVETIRNRMLVTPMFHTSKHDAIFIYGREESRT